MQIPVQVTFRDIDVSEAMREACRKEAQKLERLHDRITSCRVVIATPHRRANKGVLYSVSVDLTLPGGEVVANRDQHEKHSHEDAYVAVRDAFRATRRQLEEFLRRRRGEVKRREEAAVVGHVRRLIAGEDFGFIEAADGSELYFHRDEVVDAEEGSLEVGVEVRYLEQTGDQRPRATSVRLTGRKRA